MPGNTENVLLPHPDVEASCQTSAAAQSFHTQYVSVT